MTLTNKSLIATLSFLFFMATSPFTMAAENPFGMTHDSAEQMNLADSHGKCGDSKKEKGPDAKCSEGKCGEGKCGDSMKKGAKNGKCGEGKCGDSMKKERKDEKCGTGKCGGN